VLPRSVNKPGLNTGRSARKVPSRKDKTLMQY